jgi:PAS domain-containing protein
MNPHELFERAVVSLQEAALGTTPWLEAAVLINEISGARGNVLAFGDGRTQAEARFFFAQLCHEGQRREDLEREYFREYWERDEGIPRLGWLPDGELVPTAELYTDREKKGSPAYTEARRKTGMQNGLNVRLDGPGGSNIVLGLGESLEPGGWSSAQLEAVRRLLPHVRQFVRVRRLLSDARAQGQALSALLDGSRFGVLQLDRNARIVAANDRARGLLGQAEGLSDRDGRLSATTARDNGELQHLLARALPRLGGPGSSGSMTIARSPARTNLVVHVTPLSSRQRDLRAKQVAALVLVAGRRPGKPARDRRRTRAGGSRPDPGREPACDHGGHRAARARHRRAHGTYRRHRALAHAKHLPQAGHLA